MDSGAFDTYLALEAPSGSTLASNDDGGTGTNSRLSVNIDDTGEYTIWAGSWMSGASGSYRLGVEQVEDLGGDNPDLRSISYGETKEGYIDASDGADPMFNDTAEPVSFSGEAGDAIVIEMTSDSIDPWLILEGPDGSVVDDNDDASTSTTNSRLELTLSQDGDYTIWAGSLGFDAAGSYELSLHRQ
ncbi:MAG: PPC domain-containing protein [Natrialbaceae archaeon]|nr:PPC domain-containing protein [Natrialbaceae archaeon]